MRDWDRPDAPRRWIVLLQLLMLALAIVLAGCASSSIHSLGTIPETRVACYAVKDRDFFVAGVLLLCTQDGQVQAASGGAASGPAGFLGSVVQGAGTLGAGLAIGSGITALDSLKVRGQIVPDHVNVGGTVGITGSVHMVP